MQRQHFPIYMSLTFSNSKLENSSWLSVNLPMPRPPHNACLTRFDEPFNASNISFQQLVRKESVETTVKWEVSPNDAERNILARVALDGSS